MDQYGIFESIESSSRRNDAPQSYRAPEAAVFPMVRLQAWAGLAAALASRIDYVPAQRDYLVRG
ncbi:MAG TPA: hypothetical protein VMV41_08300 [Cellulomonadaceae bacterium]|nr:hypothetical protein [Cellulomonadaceae bacterium]